MNKKTVCLFNHGTNEVIACIRVDGNKMDIDSNLEIKVYEGTELYFEKLDGKVFLKENIFGIKL